MARAVIEIEDNHESETLSITIKFFGEDGSEGVKDEDSTLAHQYAITLIQLAGKDSV